MSTKKLYLSVIMIFVFAIGFNALAQLKNTHSQNPSPKSPQIGIGDYASVASNTNLFKGQKKYLGGYNVSYSSGEDQSNDGIYEAYNYLSCSNSNLHWLSLRQNFQADVILMPFQRSYGISLYADATNLSVGGDYSFQNPVCAEEPISGSVGGRACVQIYTKWVHVIPYFISLTSIQSSNGSSSNYQINWNAPSPLYCTIDHYELYRRDTDTIKISELNFATRLSGNILSTQRTITVTNDQRNKNSYYVLVCYDKYGEAIGISKNHQITFPTNTFSLSSPADGSVVTSLTPTLDWQDYGTGSTYKLTLSSNSDFSSPTIVTGITQSEYTVSSPLSDNLSYYWKVEVEGGGVISNQTGWNFNVNVNNNTPNNFALTTPSNSGSINTLRPYLSWDISNDIGDVVNYNILIATDNTFTNVVVDDIVQTNYYWVDSNLADDTQYYWKVKATDSQSQSSWSDAYSFSINYDNYPSGFELISPDFVYNGRPNETGLTPTFSWNSSTDTDPSSSITYTLWYSQDSSFATKTQITGLTTNSYTVITQLEEDKQYFWKVFAIDNNGNQTQNYGKPYSFVTNSINSIPSNFILISPSNNSTLSPITTTFSWNVSSDSDLYDQLTYEIQISQQQDFSSLSYSNILYNQNSIQVPALNSGHYYWRVNTISINAQQTNGGTKSSSTCEFDVDTKSIVILKPNAATNWMINRYFVVTWITNYSLSNIKIEFTSDNGSNWNTIESNYSSNANTYSWHVPSVIGSEYKIKITDVNNPSINSISSSFSTIIDSGYDSTLVLYLPFNGDCQDSSGNGYTSSVNKATGTDRLGRLNNSFFNENNYPGFGGIDYAIPLDFRNGFSITAWIKMDGRSVRQNWSIITSLWGNELGSLNFLIDPWLQFGYFWEAIPYNIYESYSSVLFNSDTWIMTTLTCDDLGNVKIYSNDNLVHSSVIDATKLQLTGIRVAGGISGMNAYFWGNIDEYKLYSKTLSPEEITNFYNSSSALPVELTSFIAENEDGNVNLYWKTATEVNNYGFEILRSAQNDKWEKIEFVQGHGNSNSPKNYSYTDLNVPAGKVQYRLKQIDFDGKFEYSKIVSIEVEAPKQFSLNQNYPNPFNPTTTINYELPENSMVTLKVFDILGNEVTSLVNETKAAGRHEVKFDVKTLHGASLPSGVYFYQLRAGSFVETKKLLLMK